MNQSCLQLYADFHTMSAMSADVCRLSVVSAQIESLLKIPQAFSKLQTACSEASNNEYPAANRKRIQLQCPVGLLCILKNN